MLKFLKSLLTRKPKVVKVDIDSRFQLVSRVGQGSMSKVWRAVDRRVEKTVALKILDFEKTKRLESRFLQMKSRKPTEGEANLISAMTRGKSPSKARTKSRGARA